MFSQIWFVIDVLKGYIYNHLWIHSYVLMQHVFCRMIVFILVIVACINATLRL